MQKMMERALLEAGSAFESGEVPVGAVLAQNGTVLYSAGNRAKALSNPTAHAEMNLLQSFFKDGRSHSLQGHELYVTLEPCPMCMGALVHARLGKLVFGAWDLGFGAAGGYINLASHPDAKGMEVYGGILEGPCAAIIKSFFSDRRI
jgi:tRNA(adenine34) deaminase